MRNRPTATQQNAKVKAIFDERKRRIAEMMPEDQEALRMVKFLGRYYSTNEIARLATVGAHTINKLRRAQISPSPAVREKIKKAYTRHRYGVNIALQKAFYEDEARAALLDAISAAVAEGVSLEDRLRLEEPTPHDPDSPPPIRTRRHPPSFETLCECSAPTPCEELFFEPSTEKHLHHSCHDGTCKEHAPSRAKGGSWPPK